MTFSTLKGILCSGIALAYSVGVLADPEVTKIQGEDMQLSGGLEIKNNHTADGGEFGRVDYIQFDYTSEVVDQEDEETDTDVFSRGMAAWRKPDVIFKGAACANCHAPDGFDLAYFDFSREDIIRRAAPHLPDEADQIAVADLIEYVREQYQIVTPKDPRTFRPFQPTGAPLPGTNRFEKDKALGDYFKSYGYRFASVPVLSIEEANAQKEEWLAIDVRQVPIGFEMPLWSRDGFHGEQDVSMNDYLPSLPRLPKSGKEAEWYALQDAYIANPTDENFFNYYEAIDKDNIRITRKERNPQLTERAFKGSGSGLARAKFKGVQFASHLFRQEHMTAGQDRNARPINGFQRFNDNKVVSNSLTSPFWSVGDFFRVNDAEHELVMPTEAPFPPGLKDTFLDFTDEARQIKTEWFVLGWLFDPSLTITCCGNPGKSGEYFHHALSLATELGALAHEGNYRDRKRARTGFPIHNAYIHTKKMIDANYAPYAINQIEKHGCDIENCGEISSFDIKSKNFYSYGKAMRNLPDAELYPEQREMYVFNTLNTIRMTLYLIEDRIDTERKYSRDLKGKLYEAKRFMTAVNEENPHKSHDWALFNRVMEKL